MMQGAESFSMKVVEGAEVVLTRLAIVFFWLGLLNATSQSGSEIVQRFILWMGGTSAWQSATLFACAIVTFMGLVVVHIYIDTLKD